MVEYLLGNFMVHSGLVTEENLERVIKIQDKVRVKLGLIAVSEGYMTVKQADEVNLLQTIQDKRFGDIAIEKGYLDAGQVEELLAKQGNEYLVFAQTLVDEGIIGMEEMDAVIKGYQIENGFTDEQIELLKQSDTDGIIEMFLPENSEKYKAAAILAVKTVIRCIDRHTYIGRGFMKNTHDAIMPVTQKIFGDGGIETGVADVSGGMKRLASVFAREEFEELDENTQDACGEFLNCVNGLYASALSRRGIELELMPPEFHVDCMLSAEDMLVLPVYIGGKEFCFMATENEWR